MPEAAAAEFQEIVDTRGLTGVDPIRAFAWLRLGQAWAAAGNPGKAKAAYDIVIGCVARRGWRPGDAETSAERVRKIAVGMRSGSTT